jgi:hypothetical protein
MEIASLIGEAAEVETDIRALSRHLIDYREHLVAALAASSAATDTKAGEKPEASMRAEAELDQAQSDLLALRRAESQARGKIVYLTTPPAPAGATQEQVELAVASLKARVRVMVTAGDTAAIQLATLNNRFAVDAPIAHARRCIRQTELQLAAARDKRTSIVAHLERFGYRLPQ